MLGVPVPSSFLQAAFPGRSGVMTPEHGRQKHGQKVLQKRWDADIDRLLMFCVGGFLPRLAPMPRVYSERLARSSLAGRFGVQGNPNIGRIGFRSFAAFFLPLNGRLGPLRFKV